MLLPFKRTVLKLNELEDRTTPTAVINSIGIPLITGPVMNPDAGISGGVIADNSGHLFYKDAYGARVIQYDISSGTTTVVAGNGLYGTSGENVSAIQTPLTPSSLAVDNFGHLFIGDGSTLRVRQVDLNTGIIKTVAGNGRSVQGVFDGDGGLATSAPLSGSLQLALDNLGHLFVTCAYTIRKIDLSSGIISTIAGNGNNFSAGDGGLAINASFNLIPGTITVDSLGNLDIAENSSPNGVSRIRSINLSTGIISTIAGGENDIYPVPPSYNATGTLLNNIIITSDKYAHLLFFDRSSYVIRQFDLITGQKTIIAGNGDTGLSGDGGDPLSAAIGNLNSLAVDSIGRIFLSNQNRLRMISYASSLSTQISSTASGSIQVKYHVSDAPIAVSTKIALFWSATDKFADRIGPPLEIITVPAGSTPGNYGPYTYSLSVFGAQPAGASYLLAVSDPDQALGPFTQSGNVRSIPLPTDVAVDTVSANNFRSLTVDFHIAHTIPGSSLTVGIYRSVDNQFHGQGAFSALIQKITVTNPKLGPNSIQIDLPDDLSINTKLPYVLAVADPDSTLIETNKSNNTSFFRSYVIGAVSIGFDQTTFQSDYPAPSDWAVEMQQSLISLDKYDLVRAFSWPSVSFSPSSINDASVSLENWIKNAATSIPDLKPQDLINVHLIGHSRGSVVVSQAFQLLAADTSINSQLSHGYYKATLLDPHPANNQFGYNGDFGSNDNSSKNYFRSLYVRFQNSVHDNPITISPRVNEADVLFQHTDSSDISVSTDKFESLLFNLHGLDPNQITFDLSRTKVYYADLTAPDMGHSQVHDWYRDNVVFSSSLATSQKPAKYLTYASPSNVRDPAFIPGSKISNLNFPSLQNILLSQTDIIAYVDNDSGLQHLTTIINSLPVFLKPVSITIVTKSGIYGDLTFSLPNGLSVIFVGNASGTTVEGHSPALTLKSGNLLVNSVNFTTSTDSPTILVTGGLLSLYNTQASQIAGNYKSVISIDKGSLDLGSNAIPGNNSFNTSATGDYISGSPSSIISSYGNVYFRNGSLLSGGSPTYSTLTASTSTTALGTQVVFTAKVRPVTSSSAIPSGKVIFYDTSSGKQVACVTLINGTATYSISNLTVGSHDFIAVYQGSPLYYQSIGRTNTVITNTTLPSTPASAMIRNSAGKSLIDWYDKSGTLLWTISPPAIYGSGSITIVEDRNGDGLPDLFIGSQAGYENRVGLLDGKSGSELWYTTPYAKNLKMSVNVASGDITGDGKSELVVSPGYGGGPNVKAYQQNPGSGIAFTLIRDFNAYASTYTGGVNIAVGDVDRDGTGDIVTGTGIWSNNVRVFSQGKGASMIQDFFAFSPSFQGGVTVACGDLNNDGYADIITGTQTQASRIKVFSGNGGLRGGAVLLDTATSSQTNGIQFATQIPGSGTKFAILAITRSPTSLILYAYYYSGNTFSQSSKALPI